MFVYPHEVEPGRDLVRLDDGTNQRIEAVWSEGGSTFLELPNQLLRCDPDVKITIQRPYGGAND